jgi:hypothetical protein
VAAPLDLELCPCPQIHIQVHTSEIEMCRRTGYVFAIQVINDMLHF